MNSHDLPPPQNFAIAKGQDWPLEIRVFGPEKSLKLTADAAAAGTSLTVNPDHPALSDGDKFLFGEHVVVTVDGNVAAGTRTVTVDALAGPLQSGEVGRLLRDLTGWTVEMEVLARAGDALPVISKTGGDVLILTQSGADRGKLQISGSAADTEDVDAGEYTWFVWRRDSGEQRPIARGLLRIEEAGFL